MNKFELLDNVIKNSGSKLNQMLDRRSGNDFMSIDKGYGNKATLYFLDNLDAMLHLLETGSEGKIDLIYIDPPFNTSSSYKKKLRLKSGARSLDILNDAYSDNWKDLKEYLEMMTIRLMLIHRLLSDKGSLYLHVDYRTSHYFRLILDHIFGENRFLNEVIWSYKSGGTGRRSFSRKHDNILVYTKTDKYIFNPQKEKSYNRGLAPYRFKNVEEFKDDVGWHTLVNLKDVWSIDMVGRTSGERVGYETQKPVSLLRRIIQTSSDDGSIVADFFLGSGTSAQAALELGREFIGSDSSPISYVTVNKRLRLKDVKLYIGFKGNQVIPGTFKYKAEKKDNVGILCIEGYLPSKDEISNRKVEINQVHQLLEEDPMVFLDYIGIIGVNKGRILLNEFYSPDIPSAIVIPEGYGQVILQVVDVFGSIQEIAIGGDNIEQD